MAEAETQEEVSDAGAVNVVKLIEDQNSYINSSKERMYDVITTFVNNAENSIALNDFSQIFKTVTVWIKFRPRKLGQYVEIMKERTTETTISIRYSDDIYIPHIKEVLKEHKIKMISNDHNVMVCKTPRPSDQDIEIAVQKIKVLETLNFEIYDPSLICIEILGYRDLSAEKREIEIKQSKIYKFLENKRYKKVWSGSSYCSHLFTK